MTAAAHWLLTTVTVELLLFNVCTCQDQSCSMGFPLTVSQCTSGCGTREQGTTIITWIIPDMNFTCAGTVTAWRAAGIIDTRRAGNAIFDIWRRESATYRRVNSIELGVCGGVNLPQQTGSNIYECILPESQKVSVQPGDIIGIEIARRTNYRFRLYFDNTNGGPTSYVFRGQPSTPITLDQASSTVQDQPQITLTVEPIMSTITTQPLTTTQDSTTNLAMTQSPTTAEDSSTAAPPEPLTTTGAAITDVAATTVGTEPTRSTTEPPTTSNAQTTQATRDPPTTTSGSDSSATTEAGPTMNNPTTMEDSSRPTTNTQSQTRSSSSGLIIGAVVGGVIGIILLSVLAILTLALVYLSRKYKSIRYRETGTATAQNADILKVEMNANQSYIPIFRQISTENNAAYGEMVNQDNSDGYLTIVASTDEDTTQARDIIDETQNKEDHYDYIID